MSRDCIDCQHKCMICASQKEESVAFMVTDKKKCGGSVVEVEATEI